MEKKNLGRTHSVGGPVLLWPMKEQCMIMIQAALQVRSQIASEYLSKLKENGNKKVVLELRFSDMVKFKRFN